MKNYGLLLLSLFLFSSFAPPHEYHVSVTQMQYNASQRVFEVSVKVFTDDLERGLSQNNGSKRFIVKDHDQNDPFVEKYVLNNFALSTTQKQVAVKYIGKEEEADATWIYLEIPFQGSLENYRLQNSVLLDVFDDQVNMFNLKHPSATKTLMFKKGKSVQPL